MNQISPDAFAQMLATIDAGDRTAQGIMNYEQVVDAANGLLKAAGLEVGDYRNFSPRN